MAHFRKYIEKYPTGHYHREAYVGLGVTHFLVGEYDTAIEYLEKARLRCKIANSQAVCSGDKLLANHYADYFVAWCRYRKGEVEEAIQILKELRPYISSRSFGPEATDWQHVALRAVESFLVTAVQDDDSLFKQYTRMRTE